MSYNFSPKIVVGGLVLYLDAANSRSIVSGSTTWTDLSRDGNNGTLVGGPTFSSLNGGSIVFDGSNNYVNLGSIIANKISNTSKMTISFWGYPTNVNKSLIVGYYNDINNRINLGPWTDGFIYVNVGGGSFGYITNLVINNWYHYVMVYDGTQSGNSNRIKLYINGTQFNLTFSGTIPATTSTISNFFAGYNNQDISMYSSGRISQINVYDKSLSSSEVLQNYNATKSRFGLK